MSALYQVVFTGELQPGSNPEQVVRDFAAVFKIPEEKAWRLILDKQEHVLKHEVDDANAVRYREVLEEIGLMVRVEPVGKSAADAGAAPPAEAGDFERRSGASAAEEAPRAEPPREPENPYAPPHADLTPPTADDDGPMPGPHRVPAGHGWLWLKDGYALFRAKPSTWLLAILLIYLINFGIGLVPLLGGLVGFLLGPIFAGGLMAGARGLDRRGTVRVGMIFDAFSTHGSQLAIVGALYLLGFFLIALAAGLVLVGTGLVSSAGLEALSSSDPDALAAAMAPMALILMLLIIMALMIPLVMAYWFAPALVVLEDMPALEAMQASFRGCMLNIVPFLVYGLALFGIILGFTVVGSLVAGLAAAGLAAASMGPVAAVVGFLAIMLAVPLLLAFAAVVAVSLYTGYRDIYRQSGFASIS